MLLLSTILGAIAPSMAAEALPVQSDVAAATEQEAEAFTSPVHQRLMGALHAHIVAETGKPASDVDVQWVGYAASIPCAETADIWVETLPGDQFRGQSTARISFVDETGVCGKVSIPMRVEFWSNIPVADADAGPGEVIDFSLQRIPQTEVRGLVVDPDKGPWIAVGSIRKGDAVTHRRAKRQPMADVGDSVQIIAQYGQLTVSAEGRMLSSAHLGEQVRVANLATDTVVQGVLIAPGKVKAGFRK